jgi:hypothetical protein
MMELKNTGVNEKVEKIQLFDRDPNPTVTALYQDRHSSISAAVVRVSLATL